MIDLFAPWNAEVTDVLVEDGQSVDTNQLLLTLRSDELSIESITVNTMLAEKRKLLRASYANRRVRIGRIRYRSDCSAIE